jgi:hypothetical protein
MSAFDDDANKPAPGLWDAAPVSQPPDPPNVFDNNSPTIPLPWNGGLSPIFPRPPFDRTPDDSIPGAPWIPAPGGDGPQPNKWWDPQKPDAQKIDPAFQPKPDQPTLPPGFKPNLPLPPVSPGFGFQDPDHPSPAPSLVPPLTMPAPPQPLAPSPSVPKLELDPAALMPPVMPPGRDGGS